jgi:NitT/TauT family transport system permease protein
MSGISYFINQQARYRNYQNVFAAIFIIGFIGLGCDLVLAQIGDRLFPWKAKAGGPSTTSLYRRIFGGKKPEAAATTQPA